MRPRVVISGTYHRDPTGLKRLFRELEVTGCRVLSPIALDFEDITKPVVSTKNEFDLGIRELELFHLRAMREADFIWLHDPAGHIGLSTAYELGFASALCKPVYCYQNPVDEMLRSRVKLAGSVFEALENLQLLT